MRSDIVPRAVFPDHTAKRRKLSDLQGLCKGRSDDPRAESRRVCPKDRRQAKGLVQLHRGLEVGYCRLVTIRTDNITDQRIRHRSGRPMAVLVRRWTQGAEGPGHCGVHRCRAQPDDSPRGRS
jgi:hypothetical protein